jgi:hypothetical protein
VTGLIGKSVGFMGAQAATFREFFVGNQHFLCVHYVYFVYTWCWWKDLKERDYLEDQGVDRENNIKMGLQKMGCWGMDCIDLAQDRYR